MGGGTAAGGASNGGSNAGGKAAGMGGKSGAGGASSGGAQTGVGGTKASGGKSGSGGSSAGGSSSTSKAADIAKRLGRQPNFLVGMGNDLNNDHSKDGAYSLGVTMDLHYAYMVGLPGQGGWPDWNANGTFVNVLTDSAKAAGVTPMFTLYAMAANGENNMAALTDDTYMKGFWDGAKLLFQRIAEFDGPALVQFEPDFWAYLQMNSQGNPTNLPVKVQSFAPDCAGLGENGVGLGKCLVVLGRKYAPKAILGFHASAWADADPAKIVKFMLAVGAGDADILTTDALDRDAGCFEAHTDPNCQRGGSFYWDEANAASPNFHEHLAWVKAMTTGTGKPMLWWQVPFGVPSTTPGGSAGHYRDNRVKYIFSHVSEFVAAGGLGAVFGVGAANQTYIDTDGGQFKTAVTKYFAAPVALP